jgi:hypothetical protein
MQHNAVLFMQTAAVPHTAYKLSWNYSSGLLKSACHECLLSRQEQSNNTLPYFCSQIMHLFWEVKLKAQNVHNCMDENLHANNI